MRLCVTERWKESIRAFTECVCILTYILMEIYTAPSIF